MALSAPSETEPDTGHPHAQPWSKLIWTALLLCLTCCVLTVHGYHPFSEDGGLYAAGIELKLNSNLFLHYGAFVRGPFRYSQFASCMAMVARITHLPVHWVLFATYLATTWLVLFASRQVLRRCTHNDAEQLGGVALLAAWWTLPIAGTSLVLMDPYVTARSFSTPLTILALAYTLDDWALSRSRQAWYRHPAFLCSLCIIASGIMHLLMAAYMLAFVLITRACLSKSPKIPIAILALFAIVVAAFLQAFAPHESSVWLAAEITRYYWFLSQWQWFELAGLAGPILMLVLVFLVAPATWLTAARSLCLAAVAAGLLAFVVALMYAREDASVHMIARLQPLRIYLPIYALMAMLLGAIAVNAIKRAASRAKPGSVRMLFRAAPAMLFLCMSVGMFTAQRNIYVTSPHVELPWRESHTENPWVQAFLWARVNTPDNALFALDAHYITTNGEDAQTFRAISLRDALPDYSKDGGEAAIAGDLAPAWSRGAQAQLSLDKENDAERQKRLLPLGVTWMILRSSSETAFACPYNIGTIKVCEMPTHAP